MNYYEYKPTLERKTKLLHILKHLKQDMEKVSFYSQYVIQMSIEEVEEELKMYRRRIYNFNTGDPNIICEATYEDYTDEELENPEKLFSERKKQIGGMTFPEISY